jgi:PAS domain S-box-containing protein
MIEQSAAYAFQAADMDSAFRALFESAPCGLILLNETGRIVQINQRLQEIFDYAPEELLGHPIEILLPHRERAHHVGLRDGFIKDPSVRPMGLGRDLAGRRKDGMEIPVEIALTFVDVPQGRLTCALVIDITMRKRAELRLREANVQLEEFTHVASHDLRSPLRGIANLIEFIEEDYGQSAPPEVRRNLNRMADRISAMERLIDDLLTYARAGRRTLKTEAVDLGAIVREVIDLEAPGEGVTITTDIALDDFDGVRVPITTVLRNLLSNAIKHHDKHDKNILIRARAEGNMCVIDVRDDGPGIAEASQARAFRLFQTVSNSGRSNSGLGLAVAKRLVEAHGGNIELMSDDGHRGCHFRVYWPRFARSDLDD